MAGGREAFRDEAGGHRWQHVPRGEKHGRVHTSTVTVAVLAEPSEAELRLDERDVAWEACRGSGAGGQNRNKRDTAVQMTHLATGLTVRAEGERSQHQNRRAALALLRARVWAARAAAAAAGANATRRGQVGSGQRGDKRRTVRVQDDQVHDHVTGRRWRYRDYARGDW